MKCPTCSETLAHRERTGREFVSVEVCPGCRGCWLSRAELESAHAGPWTSLEEMGVLASDVFSDYLCPHCSAQLVRVNPTDHPELVVDRCPSCHGLWLDNGELQRLRQVVVEYAESHGTLDERPPGWTVMRWILYRMAQEYLRAPTV